mgnify:CR=1 FL=1
MLETLLFKVLAPLACGGLILTLVLILIGAIALIIKLATFKIGLVILGIWFTWFIGKEFLAATNISSKD